MKDVFLSLSKKDIKTGYEVYDFLTRDFQISVYLYKLELLVGDIWKERLKSAIWNYHFFLVLLSENSIKYDSFVQEEIKWAQEKEKSEIESSILFVCLDKEAKKWIKDNKLKKYHFEDLYEKSIDQKMESFRNIKDKILSRKKCHQFIKKSGKWEQVENRKCHAKYDPLKYRSQPNCILSFEPEDPYTCEDLRSVSCKVKINGGFEEWRAGILLRRFDAYMDPNCILFFIADKEKDWRENNRNFAKERYIGCHALSPNLVTMAIYPTDDYRPNIPPDCPNEFLLKLEIREGDILGSVSEYNGKEIEGKFRVTKNQGSTSEIIIKQYFEINEIREVCFWASTRIKDKPFEIEFSELSIEGLRKN